MAELKRDTKFKKGVSGNPGGMPRRDPVVTAFRETTYKDFIMQMQRYGGMSRTEIEADLARPKTTMFEHIFGNIVTQAADGDKDARQVLLDRLWGKVRDTPLGLTPEASANVGPQIIIELPAKNVE